MAPSGLGRPHARFILRVIRAFPKRNAKFLLVVRSRQRQKTLSVVYCGELLTKPSLNKSVPAQGEERI